jgi:hypothetical protein
MQEFEGSAGASQKWEIYETTFTNMRSDSFDFRLRN